MGGLLWSFGLPVFLAIVLLGLGVNLVRDLLDRKKQG